MIVIATPVSSKPMLPICAMIGDMIAAPRIEPSSATSPLHLSHRSPQNGVRDEADNNSGADDVKDDNKVIHDVVDSEKIYREAFDVSGGWPCSILTDSYPLRFATMR